MHRHGCCVLQKFLESSKGEKREKLIKYLINDCEKLIIDQFGNYVIQSLLLLNEVTFSNKIVEIIIKNIIVNINIVLMLLKRVLIIVMTILRKN